MSEASSYSLTQSVQRQASDPAASAWVIANAGAGKTHVLTQRVIRLLLSGVDPAAILSLTFTKIAAAEMANRVFDTLGRWVSLSDAELERRIADLQGRPPTRREMDSARRLFAKALETPGGLKIQTIHAFCESLLHQFPFEANVPGQFAVLDDSAASAMLAAARDEAMSRAAADPGSRIGRAVRALARNNSDMQINQALDAVVASRDSLALWLLSSGVEAESGGIDDVLAELRKKLGLAPVESEEAICLAICNAPGWKLGDCAALVEALAASSNANDRGAATALRAIVAAEEEPAAEALARLSFFLTSSREGWKPRDLGRRFSKAFGESTGLKESFTREAERVLVLSSRLSIVRAYEATEALLVVGDAILGAYQAAKRRTGALDFSDLIVKTRNLLSRADAADWVLYKLDSRIEHVLVDEAQDTSPEQWAVVQALAEDFFAGRSASDKPRTIFAVGDDKQSIFGFQGAAPWKLAEMQRFFETKAAGAGAPFFGLKLFLSFRSTREVLEAVDTVFTGGLEQRITASTYVAHASHRLEKPGRVILMPRVRRQKVEEPEDWTEPYDAPGAAETALARRIAAEVASLRNSVLPSGKLLRDGEILLLVRRRDALFAALNRELLAQDIPTTGADRIPIASHIAVLDLLALADVMLLPEDDLQLAALLKSPLLSIGEDELMWLAAERGKRSLWSALRGSDDMLFAAAAKRLRAWRSMSDKVTPFRFFATVLGPDGGRRAFRARLGGEADDVLDAFLSQALAYEISEAPSLQGFVRFIRANRGDLKREAVEAAPGVRIMTVHGAKGLEADVVFLVDTGGLVVVPNQRDRLVRLSAERGDPAFLWRRNAAEAIDLQREADERADRETEAEYLRLLYVAMTRARDLLYVAGIRGERTPEDCWYSLIERALVHTEAERGDDGELAAPFHWPPDARQPLAPEAAETVTEEAKVELPDWLEMNVPSPPSAPEPLRPSAALAEPDPLPAAGAEPSDAARQRGILIHALLDALPRHAPSDRAAAAARILAPFASDAALQLSARQEAEAVLAAPDLAALFGPESRAEVAIVGELATERGRYAVSGRIDRLVREPGGWRLVDFKTDRAIPADAGAIPKPYMTQLALYRRLLQLMQPHAAVAATLVYTGSAAGPKILPVPERAMEEALAGLGIRADSVP